MELRDYLPTRVLHDFVGRIEPLGIKYMLTGSMAMMSYAGFRQTAILMWFLNLIRAIKTNL